MQELPSLRKQQNGPKIALGRLSRALSLTKMSEDDSMIEETSDMIQNEASEIDSNPKEDSREITGSFQALELSKVRKIHHYNDLRVLSLQNSQLGWREVEKQIEETNFPKNLQNLDISENYLQDKGVWMIKLDLAF